MSTTAGPGGGLMPTIGNDDAAAHIGTRILVGPDRHLAWTTRGSSVQVSVLDGKGRLLLVLATAERGFSYEAALAAYALLKGEM